MTADARYVVDPAKRSRPRRGDPRRDEPPEDTKTHRYFFDRAFLAVQPGTTSFRITSAGVTPKVAVRPRHTTYNLLRIDFGKQLGAGGVADVQAHLRHPGPGRRRPRARPGSGRAS